MSEEDAHVLHAHSAAADGQIVEAHRLWGRERGVGRASGEWMN